MSLYVIANRPERLAGSLHDVRTPHLLARDVRPGDHIVAAIDTYRDPDGGTTVHLWTKDVRGHLWRDENQRPLRVRLLDAHDDDVTVPLLIEAAGPYVAWAVAPVTLVLEPDDLTHIPTIIVRPTERENP